METATATKPRARLKNAERGSRRTVQEKIGTPQGRLQLALAPCTRVTAEAAVPSRAPAVARDSANQRATPGSRIAAKQKTPPQKSAISEASNKNSGVGTSELRIVRLPPQDLVDLGCRIWRPLKIENRPNLLIG